MNILLCVYPKKRLRAIKYQYIFETHSIYLLHAKRKMRENS